MRNCSNRLGLTEGARAVASYTDEVAEELEAKAAKKVFGLGNLRLYECPLTYITEDTAEVMRLVYLADGTGHLMRPGGLGDQPCWFLEAIEIFKQEKRRGAKERGD